MSKQEISDNYEALSFLALDTDSSDISEQYVNFKLVPDLASISSYYKILIKNNLYLAYYFNSVLLTSSIVIGQCIIASMAAYGFSKFRFRFRDSLFFAYIIAMIMPFQVTLVPNYIILNRLGLIGSRASIILPGIFSAFGVFLLRQVMISIPDAYIESSVVEGANHIQIFLYIIAPMARSGIAALCILVFIDNWNMVEQPLIFLNQSKFYPLSVILSEINKNEIDAAFAASVIYFAPALLMFLFCEPFLIKGIQLSGIGIEGRHICMMAERMDKKDIHILKISALFFFVMVLLFFFSNTINNLTIPKVAVVSPKTGALLFKIEEEGIIHEKNEIALYSQYQRWIEEINVSAGDRVTKGQVLMTFDKTQIRNELYMEEIRLKKINVSLTQLNNKKQQLIDKYENIEFKNALADTEQKKEIYEEKLKLSDLGIESKSSIMNARNEYFAAQTRLEAIKLEHLTLLDDLDAQINSLLLDLDLQRSIIARLEDELSNKSSVLSPVDGIIKQVNYIQGEQTSTSRPLFSIGVLGELICELSLQEGKESLISENDEVEIIANEKIIHSKVDKIIFDNVNKNLKVQIKLSEADKALYGKKCLVRFEKKSQLYDVIIDKKALGKDSIGNFVYVIKEKRTILKNEYYVKKVYVDIYGSDNQYAAVKSGLNGSDYVVVDSSKPVYDGSRVLNDG
jgi:multiple sugar transport system permease protein